MHTVPALLSLTLISELRASFQINNKTETWDIQNQPQKMLDTLTSFPGQPIEFIIDLNETFPFIEIELTQLADGARQLSVSCQEPVCTATIHWTGKHTNLSLVCSIQTEIQGYKTIKLVQPVISDGGESSSL